jgi:hypothetical protein
VHTDLGFLETGRAWPPEQSLQRLQRYRDNRKLWQGRHAEVFSEALRRIDRWTPGGLCGYPVVPNFHRLVTLKTADLLMGEPPLTACASPAQNEALQALLDATGWQNLLYQAAIDLSRYGEAVLLLQPSEGGAREDGNGGAPGSSRPTTSTVRWVLGQPERWFPVCDGRGQTVTAQVYAWREKSPNGDVLSAHIYRRNSVEIRRFALSYGRLGGELGRETVPLSLGDGLSPIVVLQGVRGSETVFGTDDYLPIDSLTSELMVVMGNVANILDKHAAPSMSGPSSALESDGRGGWTLPAGQYFIRDDAQDAEVKYITWDGHLESSFAYIQTLLQQIYTISELGEVLLGCSGHTGVTTYRGLKLRMTSALCKVRRLATQITEPLREAVAALASANGLEGLRPSDLRVTWFDGLPNEQLTIDNWGNGGQNTRPCGATLFTKEGGEIAGIPRFP